jgi:hypothetical protein
MILDVARLWVNARPAKTTEKSSMIAEVFLEIRFVVYINVASLPIVEKARRQDAHTRRNKITQRNFVETIWREGLVTICAPGESWVLWVEMSPCIDETVVRDDALVFGKDGIEISSDKSMVGCEKIRGNDGELVWT